MRVEHTVKKDGLYVKLLGELDEHSSAIVRTRLDELTDRVFSERLVLDMSELTFMDSTGVGVLLGRYKKLKSRGVPIYIKSPRPNVERVLVLSGIYNIMYKAV